MGKIYHTKLRFPLELDGAKSEAVFSTQTRQMKVKIPFVAPVSEQDGLEDVFADSVTKNPSGEALLANNFKKVQEHQLEIKSDLLNDIM